MVVVVMLVPAIAIGVVTVAMFVIVFLFALFFVFKRTGVVFYIMQCAQCVNQLLSPDIAEVFFANNQCGVLAFILPSI